VVGRLAQDIASASQDNDNHVDTVMEQVTDTIVLKVEEGTKHLDSKLQEIHHENTVKVDNFLTIIQENQPQILE
jgi:hypothetical protein